MRLTFLGGTGTVTGSKYLVEAAGRRILVDCGLFQGQKPLRQKNWEPLPLDAASVDVVVLTHAHIDHSGFLPRLVKDGFSGSVYATPGTVDLCRILLPDAAMIMEEDAEAANRGGYSKHRPALPLYTREDADRALAVLRAVPFHQTGEILPGIRVRFQRAGHILGASSLSVEDASKGLTVVFSGDIGRSDDPVMKPPEAPPVCDALIVESTYGDRNHKVVSPMDDLASAINDAAARGGVVLVPAFAVGRSQLILHLVSELKRERRIPDLEVYLDSPMASNVTDLFCRYKEDHRLTERQCDSMCSDVVYVRSVEDSKRLVAKPGPKIIVAASGMATGGRVLHHLKAFGLDPRTILLFAGYQAPGTRGANLVAGRRSIKIHGAYYDIKAEIRNLSSVSAHADADGILAWLRDAPQAPRIFVTHGEPPSAAALRFRIDSELGWSASVPAVGDSVEISTAAGKGHVK